MSSASQNDRKWARAVLGVFLRAREVADLVVELDELYEVRRARDGEVAARRWYRRHVWKCVVRLNAARIVGSVRRPGLRITAPSPERRSLSESIGWDLRTTVRSLRGRPGYSVAVALTLALGLAGLCTVYSVANWVLLRPVPHVRAPGELVLIRLEEERLPPRAKGLAFSEPDARTLAARSARSADFTAVSNHEIHFAVGAADDAVRIPAQVVWPNFFELLGTRVVAGRSLMADSASPVAVISDRLARKHWPRPRDAIGAEVFVNGTSMHVIGVAPAGFHGPEVPGVADLWLPASTLPTVVNSRDALTDHGGQAWGRMIARPNQGVNAQRLATEFRRSIEVIRAEHAPHSFGSLLYNFRTYQGIGLNPGVREDVKRTLKIVGAAAILLLLLTCANVAGLGLSRAVSTASNAAVRRALGAGRARLAWDWMLESVVLALAGGVLAIALTAVSLKLLQAASLSQNGLSLEGVQLQPRVWMVAFVVALLSGILAGIVPALRTSRTRGMHVFTAARHGDRGAMSARSALVVAQVALSVVLVIGGGLMARTLWNLQHVPLGFRTHGILRFDLDAELQGYDDARTVTLLRSLTRELEQLPGVESAAMAFGGPFQDSYFPASFLREGQDASEAGLFARKILASSSFAKLFDLQFIAGEGFAADWLVRDSARARVVVVDELTAQYLFPGVAPSAVVGRTIAPRGAKTPWRITGVVKSAHFLYVNGAPEPFVVVPWSEDWVVGQFTMYVHTLGDARALAQSVRRIVHDLDPTLPVYGLNTMRDEVNAQIVSQRFIARLAVGLACTGLILAMIGLYGTLSYAVAERRKEMGVRCALGARPAQILAMILETGLGLTAAGVLIGLFATVYWAHFLTKRLFDVKPFDGTTYLAGAMLLFAVSLCASFFPGWRAARVDPVAALRQD